MPPSLASHKHKRRRALGASQSTSIIWVCILGAAAASPAPATTITNMTRRIRRHTFDDPSITFATGPTSSSSWSSWSSSLWPERWSWPTSTTTASSSPASTGSVTAVPTPSPTYSKLDQDRIDYGAYVHEHGVAPQGNEYPSCPMQRSMDAEGVLCASGASWVAITKSMPPQLGRGSAAKRPVDPQGLFPEPLQDLRPLPPTIPQNISDHERGTYYFLYRSLLNFYAVISLWKEGGKEGGVGQYPMGLPEVWGEQRLYYLDDEEGGSEERKEEGAGEKVTSTAAKAEPGSSHWQAPLVMSFVRNETKGEEEGATLLVLIRGTVYANEWNLDFQYDYAAAEEFARFFPLEGEEGREEGRVHGGFFDAFSRLARPLKEEVGWLVGSNSSGKSLRKRPRGEEEDEKEDKEGGRRKGGALQRVLISGHSLGGSVGAMVALYIAEHFPEVQVDLVTFGAPNVGNAAVGRRFDKAVNNRHVTFTGVGGVGKAYYIGDWISQVPCGHLTACPLLESKVGGGGDMSDDSPLPRTGSFNYTALGGAVPFTADDLGPHAAGWRTRSDLSSYRYSPVASHVCSYLCFTAPVVGDKEDRCQFTLDFWDTTAAPENRCPHWM